MRMFRSERGRDAGLAQDRSGLRLRLHDGLRQSGRLAGARIMPDVVASEEVKWVQSLTVRGSVMPFRCNLWLSRCGRFIWGLLRRRWHLQLPAARCCESGWCGWARLPDTPAWPG